MVDLKAALAMHGHLTPPVMLALASQLVGNLIALQDQTRYTGEAVMEIVVQNVQLGNSAVIDTFLGNTAGNA